MEDAQASGRGEPYVLFYICHEVTPAKVDTVQAAASTQAHSRVELMHWLCYVLQLINPCNSTLHPAVREAKIKPEGAICCLALVCTSSRLLQGLSLSSDQCGMSLIGRT